MIFFVSRDVQFVEDLFPYFDSLSTIECMQWDAYLSQPVVWDDDVYDIADVWGGGGMCVM